MRCARARGKEPVDRLVVKRNHTGLWTNLAAAKRRCRPVIKKRPADIDEIGLDRPACAWSDAGEGRRLHRAGDRTDPDIVRRPRT